MIQDLKSKPGTKHAVRKHTSGHLSPSILVIWEDLKGFHSPTYGNNLSSMSRRLASRCKRRTCFRQSSDPSLAHHFCSRAAFCETWYDLRVRYISPTVKLILSVDSSRNWVSASVEISDSIISLQKERTFADMPYHLNKDQLAM